MIAALPLLLARHERLLVLGQLTTLGPGQLGAKVEGLVLAVGVELAQVLLLHRVHDDVDAGDRLPHRATAKINDSKNGKMENLTRYSHFGELGSSAASDLRDAQRHQLLLEVFQLFLKLIALLRAQLAALDLRLRR